MPGLHHPAIVSFSQNGIKWNPIPPPPPQHFFHKHAHPHPTHPPPQKKKKTKVKTMSTISYHWKKENVITNIVHPKSYFALHISLKIKNKINKFDITIKQQEQYMKKK